MFIPWVAISVNIQRYLVISRINRSFCLCGEGCLLPGFHIAAFRVCAFAQTDYRDPRFSSVSKENFDWARSKGAARGYILASSHRRCVSFCYVNEYQLLHVPRCTCRSKELTLYYFISSLWLFSQLIIFFNAIENFWKTWPALVHNVT